MPAPVVANCPPGLEYLSEIDQMLVKQQVELLEGEGQLSRVGKSEVDGWLGVECVDG